MTRSWPCKLKFLLLLSKQLPNELVETQSWSFEDVNVWILGVDDVGSDVV